MQPVRMVSEQWAPSIAYSHSNSTSSFSYDKESSNPSYNDISPRRRRRFLFSPCFWVTVVVMAVLLLGLILGLSIGLTQAKQSTQSPDPNPPAAANTHTPPPTQMLGPKIDLGYTTVQGLSYPGGISQWLGVRYAQPPLGNLRFAEPQNVTADANVQMVTHVSLRLVYTL